MNRSRLNALFPSLLAGTLSLLAYAITLGGTLVFDDLMLRNDPRFSQPGLWYRFWVEQYWAQAVDKLYRPLTCTSFVAELAIFGERPWEMHLVNIILNALAAAGVAELGRRLVGLRAGIVAGVLFAVHPVHVEAVAGLVGRAELLCTAATVWALIGFLGPMSWARCWLIVAAFIVAMLSKEQGILFPLILCGLIPFRRQVMGEIARSSTSDSRNSGRGLMAGLLLSLAIYIVARESLVGFYWDRSTMEWPGNPMIRSVGLDRWLMPFVLLGRYVGLFVFPIRFSLDYGSHEIGWVAHMNDPHLWIGIVAATAFAGSAVAAVRRKAWNVVALMAGLAVSYGMVSNGPILIGTIFGERLMYLPSVFVFILLAALLQITFRKPAILATALILISAPLAYRTMTRAKLWNDPLALYQADLRDHPNSMLLHLLVSHSLLESGRAIESREVARDSVRRLPEIWQSYQMVVVADLALKDYADAYYTLDHADRRSSGLKIEQLRQAVKQAQTDDARQPSTAPTAG